MISSMKYASTERILMTWLILHKVTSAVGLHLAWHPSMIRPGTDVQTPPSCRRLIFTVTFLDANQPC